MELVLRINSARVTSARLILTVSSGLASSARYLRLRVVRVVEIKKDVLIWE